MRTYITLTEEIEGMLEETCQKKKVRKSAYISSLIYNDYKKIQPKEASIHNDFANLSTHIHALVVSGLGLSDEEKQYLLLSLNNLASLIQEAHNE